MLNITNSIELSFDYGNIDHEIRTELMEDAGRIKSGMKRAAQEIVEAGEALAHWKKVLPHGVFSDWIVTEFGLDTRMAQHWMNAARQFAGNSEKFSVLPVSAWYLLAAPSTPQSAVDEVEAQLEAGDVPKVAEVKATIAAHKEPPPAPAVPPPVAVEPPTLPDTPMGPEIITEAPKWDAEPAEPAGFMPSDRLRAARAAQRQVSLIVEAMVDNEEYGTGLDEGQIKRMADLLWAWLEDLDSWLGVDGPDVVEVEPLPAAQPLDDDDLAQIDELESRGFWEFGEITRPRVALAMAHDMGPDFRPGLLNRYHELSGRTM